MNDGSACRLSWRASRARSSHWLWAPIRLQTSAHAIRGSSVSCYGCRCCRCPRCASSRNRRNASQGDSGWDKAGRQDHRGVGSSRRTPRHSAIRRQPGQDLIGVPSGKRTIEHAKGVRKLESSGRVSGRRRRGWRLRLVGALRWRAAHVAQEPCSSRLRLQVAANSVCSRMMRWFAWPVFTSIASCSIPA